MAGLHPHRRLAVLALLSAGSLCPRPAAAIPAPAASAPDRATSSEAPEATPAPAPAAATHPAPLPPLPPPTRRPRPPPALSVDVELSLGYVQRQGPSDYLRAQDDELEGGSSAAAAVGVSLFGQRLQLDATFDLSLGLLRGEALELPGRAGAQDHGPLWRIGGRVGYRPLPGRQGPLLRVGLSYARAALSLDCGGSCPVAALRASGISPELSVGFQTQPLASQPTLQVYAALSYAPVIWLSAAREDGAGQIFDDLPTANHGTLTLGQGHRLSHLLRIQLGLRFGWVPPPLRPPPPPP